QPGPQVQVEGVAEDDLCPERTDLPGQHALDRAVGTDRHECRRFHRAAWESEPTAARGAVAGEQFEGHAAHCTALPSTTSKRMSLARGDAFVIPVSGCRRGAATTTSHPRTRRTDTAPAPHARKRP